MMIATIEGRKSLDIPETLEEYSNMAGNTPSDYVLYLAVTLPLYFAG